MSRPVSKRLVSFEVMTVPEPRTKPLMPYSTVHEVLYAVSDQVMTAVSPTVFETAKFITGGQSGIASITKSST